MTAKEWADFSAWWERVTAPDYREWEEGVRRIGGCAHPIHLRGTVRLVDTTTGEIVYELGDGIDRTTLLVPCGNRRREWCAPCSRVYQWDTWHLVKAGLVGGKGVPDSVAERPRVFATLTAPSFGPVHAPYEDHACHPRRNGGQCEHDQPLACWEQHAADDAAIGQALCAGCYDYAGAVLWNAHASKLWHRFTDLLRRQELPRAAGVTRAKFASQVRVSFVKVTEFQRRGLVHFHAVIRLDPVAAEGRVPGWATPELISSAVHRAVPLARLTTPYSLAGQWDLSFGTQVDVQPIPAVDSEAEGHNADAVASYIAKYVTKGVEDTGSAHRPVYCKACRGTGLAGACHGCEGSGLRISPAELPGPLHARAMVGTAARLGGFSEYRELNLRRWAHQYGYGGHFATKSRSYSTTMAALRGARADFRAEQTRRRLGVTGELAVDSELLFSGTGYANRAEEQIAEGIRDAIEENRIEGRAALAELLAEEERWKDWI
ncbi:replication initiator [Streptomyces alboflavus]|uniref:replication initiator n=1 Tax=Streptomyces alboflavus TaxID=67267 RepID=UPI0036BA44B8